MKVATMVSTKAVMMDALKALSSVVQMDDSKGASSDDLKAEMMVGQMVLWSVDH